MAEPPSLYFKYTKPGAQGGGPGDAADIAVWALRCQEYSLGPALQSRNTGTGNGPKVLRLQARPADQGTIHILQRQQLCRIRWFDRPPI
jgi:hypothetical protein